MIIGLTGPQGAGKSTLLTGLKQIGFTVDEFKVSRSVQRELGWDNLERVKDDPLSMMDFQNRIFEQKVKNEKNLASSPVLTERTFADIFAYTKDWTTGFVNKNMLSVQDAINFLAEYRAKCIKAQLEIYDCVIFLPYMDHIVFEDDPHRAKSDSVQVIQDIMESFLTDTRTKNNIQYSITHKSVQDRIKEATKFINLTIGQK